MDTAQIIQWVVVLLFALSFHEAAHAWSANKLGDTTARDQGRISLNPLVHIDPFMTVLFPAMMIMAGLPPFGAAKPVPVDTRNLAHPKRDHAWIAAAGPISNILLAVVSALLLRLLLAASVSGSNADFVAGLLLWSVQINLILAAFNLLPIPPLDGSWILAALLPDALGGWYRKLQPYGFLLLILLLWSGALGVLLRPVQQLGMMLILQ